MDILGLISHSPKTLYSYCIDYIACHLHMIECLVGLPEILGKEIFDASELSKSETHDYKTPNIRNVIQVFFEAYGTGDILQSLSLNTAHVFFNDIIDYWWIFEHLAELDLSSCHMGDEHDVLPVLGTMQRLQTLVLRDNSLTDEGIRRVTTRSRMYQKSSSVLKFLDISSNRGITVRSLSFLEWLPSVVVVIVSDTSITLKDTLQLGKWQRMTGQDICECVESSFCVKTRGWAADLLENWKLQSSVPNKPCTSKSSSSPAISFCGHRFYSQLKSRAMAKVSSDVLACKSAGNGPRLVLKSSKFSCHHIHPEVSSSTLPDFQHQVCSATSEGVGIAGVGHQRICKFSFGSQQMLAGSELPGLATDSSGEDNVLSQYISTSTGKRHKGSLLQQLEDLISQ